MHQTVDAALEMNLLHANDVGAKHNQAHFDAWGAACLNVMSSPDAAKTVLLEKTLAYFRHILQIAVIEGDMTTELDADRLRQHQVPVVAINTGRACHLDAHMVSGGIHYLSEHYDPQIFDLILVENVGNLVCPASFDLGEDYRVTLMATTEGDDKPKKYPRMFLTSEMMLVSKVDLLPYLPFSVDAAVQDARDTNPDIKVIELSTIKGTGVDEWCDWLLAKVKEKQAAAKVATV